MKYIEDIIRVKIRFSETDAMGVVWHGNYLKFFEDGREVLGETFGMSYFDVYSNGFVIPIVKVNVNYKSPIYYGEEVEVRVRQIHTKVAKIVFQYEIWNLTSGKLSCVGSTEQVFLNEKTRMLELFAPDFYTQWFDNLNWVDE